MSDRLLKNLRELNESIQHNVARVEDKLSAGNSGKQPDPAVVVSAAKYHSALERLADE